MKIISKFSQDTTDLQNEGEGSCLAEYDFVTLFKGSSDVRPVLSISSRIDGIFLSHYVVSSTHRLSGIQTHNVSC
jgi:hypothetical protein